MSAYLVLQWGVCLVCLLLVNFNSNEGCTKSLGCTVEPGRACGRAWGTILTAFEAKNFTGPSIPSFLVSVSHCSSARIFYSSMNMLKPPVRPRSEVVSQLVSSRWTPVWEACLESARYHILQSTPARHWRKGNWTKSSSDVVMRK